MFKKYVLPALAGLIVAVLIGWSLTASDAPATPDTPTASGVVTVSTAAAVAGERTISLVGSVRSFSEAGVTAERGGRVTSVPVTLGQTVQAGQVIATLENAAERAAVLQAEGAYEAALAAAAQSAVGTDEAANQLTSAKNNAVTTYQTAFGTVNATVLTTIDQFFTNPNASLPGLRIDGRGQTAALNTERVAFQTILSDWQADTRRVTANSDLLAELATAAARTARTVQLLDAFISVFEAQDSNVRYTDAELTAFISQFTSARAALLSTQAGLEAAQTQITAATEAATRATLAASGGANSAADAQIKQALGSLRAAQANLAKTILRSPVRGTVNELPISIGDFIGAQGKVAEVANNNTLEVVTYASDAELFALQPGDAVLIDGRYDGVITTIAPAVDSATGKTEVRIAAADAGLKNGETVRITGAVAVEDMATDQVRVPLAAVKFEREDGFMFRVTASSTLEKFPVRLGPVFGTQVLVTDGLGLTDAFVTDARGLRPGALVTVAN